MTSGKYPVALLTSGGDAPGMNAAIRAATALLVSAGHPVLGVRNGYRGLLAGKLEPLGMREVGSILREGGTSLGSARCPRCTTRSSASARASTSSTRAWAGSSSSAATARWPARWR